MYIQYTVCVYISSIIMQIFEQPFLQSLHLWTKESIGELFMLVRKYKTWEASCLSTDNLSAFLAFPRRNPRHPSCCLFFPTSTKRPHPRAGSSPHRLWPPLEHDRLKAPVIVTCQAVVSDPWLTRLAACGWRLAWRSVEGDYCAVNTIEKGLWKNDGLKGRTSKARGEDKKGSVHIRNLCRKKRGKKGQQSSGMRRKRINRNYYSFAGHFANSPMVYVEVGTICCLCVYMLAYLWMWNIYRNFFSIENSFRKHYKSTEKVGIKCINNWIECFQFLRSIFIT